MYELLCYVQSARRRIIRSPGGGPGLRQHASRYAPAGESGSGPGGSERAVQRVLQPIQVNVALRVEFLLLVMRIIRKKDISFNVPV